ncbi:MAG TPA: hypothetical protein PK967_06350 [Candidatus Hydrogenedentes bacterium]|nr:hypothetical protein [Candidatus Hydrogenedentota bacterium]
MDETIQRHCHELNRCNQRGGRMLSVFDLIEAQTIDLELASRLMAGITRGASFMVGARPGGAGKTTVMCALLNLVPPDCRLMAATPPAIQAALPATPDAKVCYICHEIGPGPYFAYLWGGGLRAYCALVDKGHVRATNLHADDLAEARAQVCNENGVPAAHFNAFHYIVFLRVRGGYPATRRWIAKVYESDGLSSHRLVYDASKGGLCGNFSDPSRIVQCRAFLEKTHTSGVRTIEATRAALIAHWPDLA